MEQEEEYRALREQILTLMRQAHQYVLSAYVVTGAILGLAGAQAGTLTQSGSALHPFLFLIPFAVIIPSAINFRVFVEHMAQTGSYIEVFHQKDKGAPGWEMRLHESFLPKLQPKKVKETALESPCLACLEWIRRWMVGSAEYNVWSWVRSSLVFPGVGLACLLSFFFLADSSNRGAWLFSLLGLPLLFVWVVLIQRGVPMRSHYVKIWFEVLKKESNDKSPGC